MKTLPRHVEIYFMTLLELQKLERNLVMLLMWKLIFAFRNYL